MTSVALSIRQPTLNPTRKEITTRKWQELPVQQVRLAALSCLPELMLSLMAVSCCVGIVGHGGGAGVDVGAGYDDASGHVAVAGRGAQGESGGRTTRRVASTNSAEGVWYAFKQAIGDAISDVVAVGGAGVEDDGCDMGGDDGVSISFNYGVSGAAGQASAAGRGTRGRRVRGGRGGRTARRAASTASAEGDACV
ncbi:hypothetical protein PI125_g17316 [Phytophthora idaei]|nr:hypothetical protein PI125_g17316 [Phytophthora idaei]